MKCFFYLNYCAPIKITQRLNLVPMYANAPIIPINARTDKTLVIVDLLFSSLAIYCNEMFFPRKNKTNVILNDYNN